MYDEFNELDTYCKLFNIIASRARSFFVAFFFELQYDRMLYQIDLWCHIQWLSKVEDLGVHFGDNIICGIRLQEIPDHLKITGQCSLLSSFIRF